MQAETTTTTEQQLDTTPVTMTPEKRAAVWNIGQAAWRIKGDVTEYLLAYAVDTGDSELIALARLLGAKLDDVRTRVRQLEVGK